MSGSPQPGATVRTTYRAALREAIRDALRRDPRVFLMGEDVGRYGGCFAVSKGLLEEFGPERIRDTPLSECAFVGAGIGAALGGMRPIVEIMTVNFSLLAIDQILNNAATLLHMSGGQLPVPIVIRMTTGGGRQLAAQHSHSLEGWYAHIPGLKVLAPATLEDARGMLWTALQDSNPVLFFEHGGLYVMEGDLAVDAGAVPIDRAAVRRAGRDVSLVTYGGTLARTLAAADELAARGIEAEVIDLRTLRPLDTETLVASVARTHRAVVVDEGWRSGGSPRRSPRASWSERSTSSMRRSSGCAAPRCRCRTHGTWRRLPCRARRRSWPWRGGSSGTPVPEFCMPSLGADMEAGTLLEWRVKPGDVVHRGDIVALIDTDKAEVEVEIFADGVVEELLVAPGAKVPVGTVLARLRAGAEPAATAKPTPPAPAPLPHAAPGPAGARLRVSPLARRVAATEGVDLATVRGTGEGGAITRADVERAAAASRGAAAAPAPPRRVAREDTARAAERALGMRRAIAAAMARSKREIPHYYLSTRVDLSAALRWLEAENARRPVTERLLPAALLVKATALALREVPELNGAFVDGAFVPSEAVHVGVAVSLRPAGLVAPALHHADRLPLTELMAALRDLVRRARAGVLRGSELSDATATITNLGEQGVDTVFGVIHPPQVALVGFGRVREEPWAEGGMVGARPVVTATLAADHRTSDGHRGGLFLSAVERRLRTPETL